MNPIDLLPNPEKTLQVIGDILGHVEPTNPTEQRISMRQQVLQVIDVQPLDDDFCGVGKSYEALSRDVSVAGVGFFSTQQANAKYLQLDFVECDCAQVIVEVVHQNHRGPFWVIGCKLLVNWQSANWDQSDPFAENDFVDRF